MKRLALGLALCTLIALPLFAAEPDYYELDEDVSWSVDGCGEWSYNDDFTVRIEDRDIILRGKHRDRIEVVFTHDYRLLVDGEEIELNDRQQELVIEYYDTFDDLVREAKKLGIRGAAIGIEGAKLGMQAVGGIIKAALTSYELDDLEYDLEAQADDLEEIAAELEKDAEEVEKMAEQLDDIRCDLAKETPELKELRWF